MLLGGLLLAVGLSLFDGPAHVAARALARRLTVVMTYVINLGVPPLLFAQVLYGRALYTSSVLIGAWWISIIALLILAYWLLYRFAARLDAGKPAWFIGLSAWIIVGFIARLLSTNMTLMLRPEAWRAMYSASGAGIYLPTGDPTTTPRWLLMLVGGFFIAGLWMIYLAGRNHLLDGRKEIPRRHRRQSCRPGRHRLLPLRHLGVLRSARRRQDRPRHASSLPWYGYAGYGWLACVGLGIFFAAIAGLGKLAAGWLSWAAVLIAILLQITFTVYRDAVRDLTLLSKGFDVWDRVVVTNWSVVGIFLVVFVAGLVVIGWLISVVARATSHGKCRVMSSNIVLEESERRPVAEPAGEATTRRAFLVAAGAAGLCYVGAIGYPIYRYLASPAEMASSQAAVTEVTLENAQELPAGSALMFKFGPAPAMLIHRADDSWVAFSAVCTHLGCTVNSSRELNRIHCSCHGGVYDPHTGENVSGPPPKPLKLYKVAVGETGVVVSRA